MKTNFSIIEVIEEWEEQGFSGSKNLIPEKFKKGQDEDVKHKSTKTKDN